MGVNVSEPGALEKRLHEKELAADARPAELPSEAEPKELGTAGSDSDK